MIVTSENQSAQIVLQSLIKTLFDITLLRKGPESIPYSFVLLLMCVLLWVCSSLAAIPLIKGYDETRFIQSMFNGALGILCYSAIVVFSGHSERLLQTLAAIIGCGALIWVAFVTVFALLLPFIGEFPTYLIATLIIFWSVPVEGHIIARAIDRHWYFGIAIAMIVFVIQFIALKSIDPAS